MDHERIPPDAPVETPESDPRTPNAPDPEEREVEPAPHDADGDSDDVTRQIEEAFE